MIERRHFIDDVEVRVGATWSRPAPLRGFEITTVAKCVQVNPDRFEATAALEGRMILTSATFDSPGQAAKAARDLVVDKLAAVLRA